MEERAASLGAKSTAIVVQRVLLRFVRGACEGRKFQESNLSKVEKANLTKESFRDLQTKLEDFVEAFAAKMGAEKFRDRDSLHLSAPGWQVLGLIFHDLTFRVGEKLTVKAYADVIDRLAAVDWSRYNPDWLGMVGEPERDRVTQQTVLDRDGRQRVALSRAGRTTIAAMVDYVRGHTGLTELLRHAAPEPSEEASPVSA